jgi:hypothetical protein
MAIENRIDGAAELPATGMVGRTIQGFATGAVTPFRLISGIREMVRTLNEAATEDSSARITGAILSAVFILALGWKWVWIPLLATNAADAYFFVKGRKGAREQA